MPLRSCVHRLLERWLTDVLGLDWARADQEAQLLAPGVSERVADRLRSCSANRRHAHTAT
jgi:Mn-dependent DtxR family transcriptional regulator